MLCSAGAVPKCNVAKHMNRPAPAHKGVDALGLRKSLVITSMAHLRTQDHVYLSMGGACKHLLSCMSLCCNLWLVPFSIAPGPLGFHSDYAVSTVNQKRS